MPLRRPLVAVAICAVLSASVVLAVATRSDADLVCGRSVTPPRTYQHVVVIMEENRTWSQVGGPGFGAMPYAHTLARQCTSYARWNETNTRQNSLTQYIGLTSGIDNHATVKDCLPQVCHSTTDNIFRQVRNAGGTARTFVEGATGGCQSFHHPANVPALYYRGRGDHSFCTTEVRPLTELNVNHLPTFSMIIPNKCDNGHNCSNAVVDAWLKVYMKRIIAGHDYRTGNTVVFVIYDETQPVPNLVVAPTAHEGLLRTPVAGHAAALHTIDELLGLPVLRSVRHTVSLRASAHI